MSQPRYTSHAGLRCRGWTNEEIRRHLGEPDRVVWVDAETPVSMWLVEFVEMAEEDRRRGRVAQGAV